MDLDQLVAFERVAREGSFSRAALAPLVNLRPLWWASIVAGVAGIFLFAYGYAPASEAGTKVESPAGSATPGAMRMASPSRGDPAFVLLWYGPMAEP